MADPFRRDLVDGVDCEERKDLVAVLDMSEAFEAGLCNVSPHRQDKRVVRVVLPVRVRDAFDWLCRFLGELFGGGFPFGSLLDLVQLSMSVRHAVHVEANCIQV